MSDSTFFLGFQIDTSPLQRAAQEAQRAAQEIARLGDAQQRLGQSTNDTNSALSQQAQAAQAAAQRAAEAARATQQAAGAPRPGAPPGAPPVPPPAPPAPPAPPPAPPRPPGPPSPSPNAGDEMQRISGRIGVTVADIQGLIQAIQGGGGGGVGGLLGAFGNAGGAVSRLAGGLGTAGVAIAATTVGVGILGGAIYKGAEALAQYSEKTLEMEARLKNSLGSTAAAKEALEKLREVTQETGLGFDAAADAFGRIARNNASIGLTQRQMLELTETVQKLGAVSGAGPGEMASGLMQFGQALASGRLQGDELRSIMENFPGLAKAIADNFETADGTIGITIGSLRRMGSEGELSSQKIAAAVLRATDQARKDFETLPETTKKANQRVSDEFDFLMSDLGKKWDASHFVLSVKGTFLDIVRGARDAVKEVDAATAARDAKIELRRIEAARMFAGQSVDNPNGITLTGSGIERGVEFSLGGGDKERFRMTPDRGGNIPGVDISDAAYREAQRRAGEAAKSAQKADQEAAAQRRQETQNSLMAQVAGVESATQELQSLADKRRREEQQVKQLQDAIAKLDTRLNPSATLDQDLANAKASMKPEDYTQYEEGRRAMRAPPTAAQLPRAKMMAEIAGAPAPTDTVEDLQKQRAKLVDRLNIQQATVTAIMSEADKLQQSLDDTALARTTGGGQGGARLVMQAIQQQRGDAKAAAASDLQVYIDKNLEQQIAQQQDKLDGLKQSAADTRGNILLLGKAGNEVIDAQVEVEASALRLQMAGNLSSKALLAWMNEYKGALRDSKVAAQELANAQKALQVEEGNRRTRALLGAENNPRAQRRAELDFNIAQAQRDMAATPEQRDRYIAGLRDQDAMQEQQQQREGMRGYDQRLARLKEEAKLTRLLSAEREIQQQVMEKSLELQDQGYSKDDAYYKLQIKRAEEVARIEQRKRKEMDREGSIIRLLENGVDEMRGVWGSAFEQIFTNGSRKAADAFYKGFSGIITKIASEMMVKIAVEPFEELLRNLAKIAATKIIDFMGFGGSGGTPDYGEGDYRVAATGAAFDKYGTAQVVSGSAFTAAAGATAAAMMPYAKAANESTITAYAGGGTFTNKVLDRPTLFAFAGGTGTMGEPGPEAIMPLKRGSDGRLGVTGGGGGDVQIIVNDMRSSSGAERVETKETRGANGKRQISMFIRDEVRRTMRGGEMDRDMRENFGNSRVLMRL